VGGEKEKEGKINVDNTEKLNVISLCTGYGGIELGIRRVLPNMRTVAYCEREGFAAANLVAKMEKSVNDKTSLMDVAPVWTDVKTFPSEQFHGKIFLLTGGYPCQPFSTAGQRKGKDDPRHLWPHIRRIISAIRPVLCFFENVEGHLSLGFREVQSSLRRLDYGVEAGLFSAEEVGAPHRRKRLFILAYSESFRRGGRRYGNEAGSEWEIQTEGPCGACGKELGNSEHFGLDGRKGPGVVGTPIQHNTEGENRAGKFKRADKSTELGNTCRQGLQGDKLDRAFNKGFGKSESYGAIGKSGVFQWPARPGQEQYAWEPPRCVEDSKGINGRIHKRRRAEGQGTLDAGGTGWTSKTQSPLGGNSDGNSSRLDMPGLSGIGDSELEEIRNWMSANSNRIDEIRLCGNGVVPDTAELAFRTLLQKIERNVKMKEAGK